jgi:hypothetical protein
MADCKLYWVTQAKVKPGQFSRATQWWSEKALPGLLSDPRTKSLQCFTVQFGLHGDYNLEIWQEIGVCGDLHTMDLFWAEETQRAQQQLRSAGEDPDYLEWGPSRLMRVWPESLPA